MTDVVRRESAQAVTYGFGVCSHTVWTWRKALGVDATNAGMSALLSRWAPETVQTEKANAEREPALKTPDRAEKIAAAKRGKPRPAHVIEASREANTGKKASKESRAKMSDAHKRRGTRPPAAGVPWTVEEDALLGTMKDRDATARTGRTESAQAPGQNRIGHRAEQPLFGIAAFRVFAVRLPRG